ncbi:UPF0182 family membrane protein [Caballeronia sordidicola]|uniref:UPF0182 protein PAMC26510_05450 n=1 Tax=Caballeronia sordidicola TaxID=196367 RepID=A0A242N817_CABSO|nr:UPF0182 family protein [Caballeronia sordidicola]OTP79768.1 INTEGRAL MEMBRANE PROTEIN (Rhomboid family) [Caballeronia sordidicola]
MNENPTVGKQRSSFAHEKGSVLRMPPTSRHLLAIMVVAAASLIAVLVGIAGYIEKWLWMRQLGYAGIFWTLLSVQVVMFCSTFVFVFLYLWINLRQATKNSADFLGGVRASRPALSSVNASAHPSIDLSPRLLKVAVFLISAVVALFSALYFYTEWDTYLRFRYGGSFGVSDPLLGVDVGFYIFHLPFYVLLQGSLTLLTILTFGIVFSTYILLGIRLALTSGLGRIAASGSATSHFSVLLFILAANFGWGFYLDHYELVYSTLGVVYGAGYAADHVTRVTLWIMVGVSALACALLAFNFFRPRLKTLAVGVGVYFALWLIGVYLVPFFFQEFFVQPSELALETPYLKHYIEFTRKAYQLDAIQETTYPALPNLTPEVIARNQDTIQNIRLWDSRPLLQTYQQTQAIRLYYQFYNIDTDRYHLADGYHQVMLSTRELSPELPAKAQTWVNEYLQFTHGYGAVMNFVSKTVGGGFPRYLLENVPAESEFGLSITQPSIYYGQSMSGYRIVATDIKEFDYPKGNDNVYTSYSGKGGIPLNSFWKRLLFAWTKADVNILLTSYLKPESRIQIHRDVSERVAQIAPFLRLDHDPYAVLSAGKLYWIQDAYTVSNYFPYANPEQTSQYETALERSLGVETMGGTRAPETAGAEPRATAGFDGLNYIRNSVKVVVDMYDGTVRFYVMDPKDPVLAVYRQAFPGVFNDLSELSADLKNHLRYPEGLFTVQADQYRTFHMTDPQVFYNREDLWTAPMEKYAGQTQPMEPYYILMKLPGSTQLEYLLMTPFTPQNRDNMISWMAARSDFPEYGKMLFYELPKEKLIYGPNQVEAMIDQNTTISQQLTLWNQQGSRVIRGKLIVTPIENSFLYVVPLYMTAEGTNFPQLKRVIAVTADKVVMAPTLDEALNGLFGTQEPQAVTTQGHSTQTSSATAEATAGEVNSSQARMQFDEVQKAMQRGDWDKFGKAMEVLKLLLAKPPS